MEGKLFKNWKPLLMNFKVLKFGQIYRFIFEWKMEDPEQFKIMQKQAQTATAYCLLLLPLPTATHSSGSLPGWPALL